LQCADLKQSRRFYELVGLTFSEEQHGSGPRHLSSDLDGIVLAGRADGNPTVLTADPDGRRIHISSAG
jgi:hypothetical protein